MSDIHCVVVTPEKTEVDVHAGAVTVPMFDGEFGILKGHSPLVGRLGFGILKLQVEGVWQRYFVEEGLVQVNNNVVTLLTDKVVPLGQLTSEMATLASEAAITMPTNLPEEQAARRRAMQRASALGRAVSVK